jgi:hypothetical protein
VKLIIQTIQGIIRNQPARRKVMFVVLIAAMLMLFAGMTFAGGWLTDNLMVFLAFWAACAWLALSAILLAIYDLLALRSLARQERRRLKNEIFNASETSRKN